MKTTRVLVDSSFAFPRWAMKAQISSSSQSIIKWSTESWTKPQKVVVYLLYRTICTGILCKNTDIQVTKIWKYGLKCILGVYSRLNKKKRPDLAQIYIRFGIWAKSPNLNIILPLSYLLINLFNYCVNLSFI